MSTPIPQYILYSDALSGRDTGGHPGGVWHFALEAVDGTHVVEAHEREPDPSTWGERLELLSVVRGLEALDEPARVTLITSSRYVRRGLRYGLEEWRRNGWYWERFGKLVPVKNQDLWQRVDRALRYHEVRCRYWRLDAAHGEGGAVAGAGPGFGGGAAVVLPGGRGSWGLPFRDGLWRVAAVLAKTIRGVFWAGQLGRLVPGYGR
jgi:ribonuclease HI